MALLLSLRSFRSSVAVPAVFKVTNFRYNFILFPREYWFNRYYGAEIKLEFTQA